jgi:hypothetical protein
LLYATIHASPSRSPNNSLTSEQVLHTFQELDITRTVIGGNVTVGRGVVFLRFLDTAEPEEVFGVETSPSSEDHEEIDVKGEG